MNIRILKFASVVGLFTSAAVSGCAADGDALENAGTGIGAAKTSEPYVCSSYKPDGRPHLGRAYNPNGPKPQTDEKTINYSWNWGNEGKWSFAAVEVPENITKGTADYFAVYAKKGAEVYTLKTYHRPREVKFTTSVKGNEGEFGCAKSTISNGVPGDRTLKCKVNGKQVEATRVNNGENPAKASDKVKVAVSQYFVDDSNTGTIVVDLKAGTDSLQWEIVGAHSQSTVELVKQSPNGGSATAMLECEYEGDLSGFRGTPESASAAEE